jgi:hypothetical protein
VVAHLGVAMALILKNVMAHYGHAVANFYGCSGSFMGMWWLIQGMW